MKNNSVNNITPLQIYIYFIFEAQALIIPHFLSIVSSKVVERGRNSRKLYTVVVSVVFLSCAQFKINMDAFDGRKGWFNIYLTCLALLLWRL